MIRNFEYLRVFTSAPSVLPEQNDHYRIQPWKVNEIKAYKNHFTITLKLTKLRILTQSASLSTNVNLSVTDCDKLRNFAFSNRMTAHFDRLSWAANGRRSVIGCVADILYQIIDRNFTCCHWQFLQIGKETKSNNNNKINLILNIN